MISKETIWKWFNNLTQEYQLKYMEEYGFDIYKGFYPELPEELFSKILYIKE